MSNEHPPSKGSCDATLVHLNKPEDFISLCNPTILLCLLDSLELQRANLNPLLQSINAVARQTVVTKEEIARSNV
jgi:hypothetical protein